MITTEIKQKITAAITSARKNYPSDAKHAASLGITTSVYSAVKNGQTDRVLSDANWISIARKLGVSLRDEIEWKAAKTPVFQYVTAQLEFCQQSNVSGILCDEPNIGKTFTARLYVYSDVYDDLVFYLRSIEQPLIILDEAGDLQYEAFLELKALWNATERCCAWYMMGADGLKEKINRSIECRKVGYTEMLSRYGDRFSKVTPDNGDDRRVFLLEQARIVAQVNAPDGADIAQIVRKTQGGLRRVYTEIEKLKRQ